MKPGEILYSAKGSPVLQRKVPFTGSGSQQQTHKPKERIEIVNEDGKVQVKINLVVAVQIVIPHSCLQ